MTKGEPDDNHTDATFPNNWIAKVLFFNSLLRFYKIMANQNPTELEFATVFKDKNDIIIITLKDYRKLDQYDVININLAIRHKTEGKPALKLLDARANWRNGRNWNRQLLLQKLEQFLFQMPLQPL